MSITGTDGNDRLTGTDDTDLIVGLAGDDTIIPGGSGFEPDTLEGGAGDDTYVLTGLLTDERFPRFSYRVFDEGGRDTIRFDATEAWQVMFDREDDGALFVRDESPVSFAFVRISAAGGGIERFELADGRLVTPGDAFEGTEAADRLVGTSGNDDMDGGDGNDTLIGGAGGDQLFGGDGADLMEGGAGDDYLFARDAGDTVDGGAGVDVLDLSARDDAALSVDIERDGAQGGVTVRGIERLIAIGGEGDDRLSGGALDDQIRGSGGADILLGRGGDDYLGSDGDGALLEGGDGADTLFAGSGFGGVSDATLRGGAGDDVLVHEGVGVVDGGDGDDLFDLRFAFEGLAIRGGDGDDALFVSFGLVDVGGRADIEAAVYDFTDLLTQASLPNGATIEGVESVIFDLSRAGFDFNKADVSGTSGGDVAVGGLAEDTLRGADGDDTLDGLGADDLVYGDGGDDLLIGADGADSLVGGAGNDVLYGDGGPI